MGEAWIWDLWFSMIEPYATRIPYMVGYVFKYTHAYTHTCRFMLTN